ncbi:hypothetical protein C6P40_000054 [Pichia californica]|uniref:OTU domain-containing protein n=1 Tax=Pichia californica TaxID=460514 RepID=A0A9P6WQJ7_9ASCO|nr:hypothetical protein C6P42_000806 [[Candida] californica]KAG0691437.1 hypothetical protein C6P40_000054 [[Candida] californica]
MSDRIIETENELLSRHKKEIKDLVGRTTGMKKQATKSTRKNVMKQIKEMEEDLERKHEKELKEFNGESYNDDNGTDDDDELTPEKLLAQLEIDNNNNNNKQPESLSKFDITTNSIIKESTEGKKKRNRRKEKLAQREAEIKRIQEEARVEQGKKPDLRGIELNNIKELCDIQNVIQYDITPDGHCLFASIADQLKIRQGINSNVKELRKNAANYIKENPNDFIPFLFDEETMSLKHIDEYVEKIENTAMWGGDLEILALSKVYDCPISVMMSGRSALRMNENGLNSELKLVYYQHAFGLGEHYNSLHDKI